MSAILQRFADIRRDEVAPTLVACLFFFCVLTALMVVRPAREALGMQRGIEDIRWLFIGYGRRHAPRQSTLRPAREPVSPPRLRDRDLPLLRVRPAGVLRRARPGARQHRGADRPGVLRLVQRLQLLRHDGVLGADGRPLFAGAEQAALRRHRGGWNARRDLRPVAGDHSRAAVRDPVPVARRGRVPADGYRCGLVDRPAADGSGCGERERCAGTPGVRRICGHRRPTPSTPHRNRPGMSGTEPLQPAWRPGAQHAVVQDQVDARSRHEHRQPPQKLDGRR